MKALIPIIVIAAISILLFLLYMAYGKIKDLEKAKAILGKEKAEIIKSLTLGDSINLTNFERQLILMAIEYKSYRDIIQLPQTKRIIRDDWRGLREKIKVSIK